MTHFKSASSFFLLPSLALFSLLGLACEEVGVESSYSQGDPVIMVTDTQVMEGLEARGISFSSAMGLSGSDAVGLMRADQLMQLSPRYQALAGAIADEMQATKDHYDGLGNDAFGLSYKARSGWGNASMSSAQRQFSYRLPNPSWVGSPDVFFELTGVSNRFDRRSVPARRASCGERRLLFRMAYDTRGGGIAADRQEYSRLPLSLVLVYPQRSSDCRQVALDWQGPAMGQSMVDWLADEMSDLGDPIAIELNTQIERWPQDVKPNSVGTFHGYALRVFDVDGDELSESKLENTPDVSLLAPLPSDSADVAEEKRQRRERLVKWIASNVKAIDEGRAILPQEFLATRAASYTGIGIERLPNRLFSQVLQEPELAELEAKLSSQSLAASQYSKSVGALVRRLDGMTCVGCHQTRSIVGLHLAGEERHVDERSFNKLAVGSSPHLLDEMQRRRDDINAYLASGSKSPFSSAGVAMPPPEQPYDAAFRGVHGAPCSLGVDPGLDAMRCNAGLQCQDPDGRNDADDAVGVCVTNVEVNGRRVPQTGDVCELYDYRENGDAYKDTVMLLEADSGCLCGTKSSDFPMGGMCMDACLPGSPTPEGTTCAVVSAENLFSGCFGKMPFEDCLNIALQNDRLLRNCDRETPCRDEFACMAYPGRDAAAGEGVCAPAYLFSQFLFGPHIMR